MKEDWEIERKYLIDHLRRLERNWEHSDRVAERESSRHFQTIADELESGDMLRNALFLRRLAKGEDTP
ncbi:hypothetical protein [Paenibacillus polymyxa]|uniref:hypothetical protein n=1 Tax=Paenibacillus polymyxa TaxID=1406 RepID=UPI000737C136|nr:hypothetical protein [Paenibacillus polymyxa]